MTRLLKIVHKNQNSVRPSIDSVSNQRHNRTGWGTAEVLLHLQTINRMNKVVPQFTAQRQEASLAHGDVIRRSMTGASPVNLQELTHEIRQPLGVIDSLAYYLELTTTDDCMCIHLQRIRGMVAQASRILERARDSQREVAWDTYECVNAP